MHRICKMLILIFSLFLSSCSLFHEDLSAIEKLIKNEQYTEAITKLEDLKSGYAKELNSKAHVGYAISILKDLTKDKRTRYFTAKDILEKAVNLNPKNKDAKTYYLLVLNLSQNV
jgi:tetratricopeptide (TPR) repeat protein